MKLKQGQEVVVENPWWAKQLTAIRCEVRHDCDLLHNSLITVKPLEGNPHTRCVRPNAIRVQLPVDTESRVRQAVDHLRQGV